MIFKNLYYLFTPTVIRFAIVGIINTSVFYLSFIIFYNVGINYLIASCLGYSIALVCSYFLNKIWTFRSRIPTTIILFFYFVVINLIALGSNLIALYYFVDYLRINVYISQIIAILFSMTINFIGYKWIFNDQRKNRVL